MHKKIVKTQSKNEKKELRIVLWDCIIYTYMTLYGIFLP